VDPSQLLDRLKAVTKNFTTTQLVTLGATFVLVVVIVGGSALWLNTPNYTLLFADMDPDSAAQVVERLKSMKVPYTLDGGGRSVRVQSERVDELRLELTSQGMPASGRIGFELFDRTAFGATEFLEQVNYRRALEGEIARTISTLGEVSSARVHISMAKDSLFGEKRPAKASVVLKLRAQRPLAQTSVTGIANLVASSVEGLRPESVVILDNFGRPLARPQTEGDDPLGAAHLERQQRLERDMSTRIVSLLEPVVGSDRVRVNVALTLNTQSSEETEEHWDPSNAVVRSKQSTSDVATSATVPMLVAGARGNTPTPADPKTGAPTAPAATANVPGTSRQAETTNYEVSRRTKHTVQPRGDVERLSVAVILDDDQKLATDKDGRSTITRVPRTREEIQKIQGLVSAAVGLDSERGDQLTIENVSFDEPLVEDAPPQTTMQRYAPQIDQYSRVGTVLLLGLFSLFFLIRPAMRKMGLLPEKGKKKGKQRELPEAVAAATVPQTAPKTVAELESEIEAELDAAALDKVAAWRKMPVLTRKISGITKSDPEQVARLLRAWMQDEVR
jgi:flagellar M-ring protein FliF